jgi:hypothetical protein
VLSNRRHQFAIAAVLIGSFVGLCTVSNAFGATKLGTPEWLIRLDKENFQALKKDVYASTTTLGDDGTLCLQFRDGVCVAEQILFPEGCEKSKALESVEQLLPAGFRVEEHDDTEVTQHCAPQPREFYYYSAKYRAELVYLKNSDKISWINLWREN